ncbi:hypothetical protein MmiHf6_16010 [Methanimicrococcus hongohii]|uniref:Type IV toxin-antitoxin system AbiEi family antitoxin domain-containing protein n=1 Tax=Methanimicrococcus hongohii TaxID=3028295 RepID=A0AA96VA51_9EURY|nr:DUF6088 family protein [Methanimicrococcus sp. Hf6]WNY24271.1 hypothetical protein MmiHf6_16010 [Methanimicrococcus sp. Hf6]
MIRKTYLKEIKNQILQQKEGEIYIPSDFADIANRNAVDKALSRLTAEGTLCRIMQGIYERPRYSPFLKEYVVPSPEKVAQAIARKNGWTIVPWEEIALNILGLSTQVPAVYIYASDGPTKKYEYEGKFNKITLEFRRTPRKDIANMSYKTALVIQAQKARGKDRIDERFIRTVSKKMTQDEMIKALEETKRSTAWIREGFIKIAMGGTYEGNCNLA